MAKSVTLTELDSWLNKNKHLTWLIGKGGGFDSRNKEAKALVKYIYPSFDTRTMDIFAMQITGSANFDISCSDEFEGDLIQLMELKLNRYFEKPKTINCKICLGIGCKYCN